MKVKPDIHSLRSEVIISEGNFKVTCKSPRCRGIIQPKELRINELSLEVHFGGIQSDFFHFECYRNSHRHSSIEWENMKDFSKLSQAKQDFLLRI